MKVLLVAFIFLVLETTIKLSTSFTSVASYVSRNAVNLPFNEIRNSFRTKVAIGYGTAIVSSSISTSTILYESKPKAKGVYARPSAAIERGSGFFVPGLEGSRVRILFGLIVLILSYLTTTHGMGNSNIDSVEFSQKLVLFYAVLLLFQGIVEGAKEAGLGLVLNDDTQQQRDKKMNGGSSGARASTSKELEQRVSDELVKDETGYVDKIRWVAASFIALTPATHVLLLMDEEDDSCNILYTLGDGMTQIYNDKTLDARIQSAIETVYKSKGGRVSVPESHPCSTLLPEEHRRCILLQKIETTDADMGRRQRKCLMIGSNQLLAAFTKNDLKWLGSLGGYLG